MNKLIPVSVIAAGVGRDRSSVLKRLKKSGYELHKTRADNGQVVSCLTREDAERFAKEIRSAVSSTDVDMSWAEETAPSRYFSTAMSEAQEHNTDAQVAKARRLLEKQGYGLSKIRENSQWYAQYGPYMIVNLFTNFIESYGLDLDEVQKWAEEK